MKQVVSQLVKNKITHQHGVPTVVKRYGEKSFEIDDSYTKCTIPFEREVLEKTKMNVGTNVGINVGINRTERAILDTVMLNSSITAEELTTLIGVSKRTVERNLASLQKKKILLRIG